MLAAWLSLGALTSLPYAVHSLGPPPGAAFLGFLYFDDDHYLYLSYARQAEEGAFLFQNKLVLEEHPPRLVNLEWWLVGTLSRLLSGRPFLAYRLVGLAASLLLFLGLARLLRRAGLPEDRLLPSLLLVGAGGGFGGLLMEAGWLPPERSLDFGTGLFPFVGLLGNPHFTVATALFVWALLAFARETPRGEAAGVALGSALGLVRPYDFVTLVGLRVAFTALRRPPREWPRRLAPLAGFLPLVAWNYWVFYRNPAFAFYANAPYAFPANADLVLALGPAALLALLALRAPAADATGRAVRLLLLLWCGFGAAVILARPVYFSLQFLVAIGLPLLAFAALGLSRFPRAAAWAALLALGTSALVALRLALQPLPYWFTAAERMQAARALLPLCARGDVAFAPEDIGLLVGGLTSCKAYVSHVSHPAYGRRVAEARAFYTTLDPAGRAFLLDAACARHVVLPSDDGERPARWLGEATPFRRRAVVGPSGRTVAVYSRAERPSCRP